MKPTAFRKKRGLVSALAALAVATPLAACAAPGGASGDGDTIKVGLLFPTTGDFAVLGEDQSNGARMVLEWANEQGGIDGTKIEIVEADSQSDPAVGANVAQRLIDREQVDIIIGSYSSAISQAILPVAQRNDVILWEVGAVSTEINADGNPNFLRTVGSAQTYAEAGVNFVEQFVAPQLDKPVDQIRLAIANEDGAFGSSVVEIIRGLAKERGMNIVFDDSYPVDAQDLTPLILQMKRAQPDALLMSPLVADSLLFWEQAGTQNLNIPAIVGSSGFGSPVFPDKFGAKGVEGAFNVEPPALANMNLEGLDPEVADLTEQWLDQFQQKYGKPCLVHCGDGVGGAYVLVEDVLPRALESDDELTAETIVEAASETDMPEGTTPQGFGVDFIEPDAESNIGDNQSAFSAIMQWQGGKLLVVFPEQLAAAEPIFPMPAFDER